jgi:signal recognition particle subunit SEC65
METSLHRELKKLYAGDDAQTEVALDKYRIDAVSGKQLIEIQHGSLAAIRSKIQRLVHDHRVLVVKPIVASKLLVKQSGPQGRILSRRMSPKRGKLLDIFDELVYFTRVFPHPRLTLEIVLVEVEEWRYPGHGRRRRWRKGDHVVADQKLLSVGQSVRLRRASDLVQLVPGKLPKNFHTGHLAELAGIHRHIAQRIAYCLREMQAVEQIGKQGNALLYQLPPRGRRAKTRSAL